MTAEIIELADHRPVRAFNAGNGAREAMIEVLEMSTDGYDHLCCVDFILAMLWYRGFKVVPLGE